MVLLRISQRLPRHMWENVYSQTQSFLALFLITWVKVLPHKGLARTAPSIHSNPEGLWRVSVAVYQSVFVRHPEQAHHSVSAVCLLNSYVPLLSLLFARPYVKPFISFDWHSCVR